MLLHDHPGFQSDIALLLETIGASLIVGKTSCYTRRCSWYLVRACLNGGVVLQIGNPPVNTTCTTPIRSCVRGRTQFFKIVGFAGKRFLLSPPPPPSFFFFALVPTFSTTHKETLAMQATQFFFLLYSC